MIYTVKIRKQLNARYLKYHKPDEYKLKQFASCERLLVNRPPKYATRLCDVRHAEALAAKYWIDYGLPMPVLVRVTVDARAGSEVYDVNYVHPRNPHGIELVGRYLTHTEVYAVFHFGSNGEDELVKTATSYVKSLVDNWMFVDIGTSEDCLEKYRGFI